MIKAALHAVTCIIYVGLWGRNSKLPHAFGHHLLGELMNRKWNKWCKKKLKYIASFMWLLFGHYAICTDCLLLFPSCKFLSCLSFFLFFFLLISLRTYGLHIWEMLSMVAPSPRTRRLCVVIHIWSSLLLFIITHHYYKQVRSWLPSFWLRNNEKKRNAQ